MQNIVQNQDHNVLNAYHGYWERRRPTEIELQKIYDRSTASYRQRFQITFDYQLMWYEDLLFASGLPRDYVKFMKETDNSFYKDLIKIIPDPNSDFSNFCLSQSDHFLPEIVYRSNLTMPCILGTPYYHVLVREVQNNPELSAQLAGVAKKFALKVHHEVGLETLGLYKEIVEQAKTWCYNGQLRGDTIPDSVNEHGLLIGLDIAASRSLTQSKLGERIESTEDKESYLLNLQELLHFTPEFKTQLKTEYCKYIHAVHNLFYEFDSSISTLRLAQEMCIKECVDSAHSVIKARKKYEAEVTKRGESVPGQSALSTDLIRNLPVYSPTKRRHDFFSFENIDNPGQEVQRLQEIARRDRRLKEEYEEATAKLQEPRVRVELQINEPTQKVELKVNEGTETVGVHISPNPVKVQIYENPNFVDLRAAVIPTMRRPANLELKINEETGTVGVQIFENRNFVDLGAASIATAVTPSNPRLVNIGVASIGIPHRWILLESF